MAEPGESLSDREMAVLRCIAEGGTNREIAQELSISPNTVKVHVRNIFTKLEVSSRTEATTVAIQKGYLTVPGLEMKEGDGEVDSLDLRTVSDEPQQDEPLVDEPRKRRTLTNWQWIVLAVIVVGALVAGAVVGTILGGNGPARGTSEATATGDNFEEVSIDSTNWFITRPLPRERANMAIVAIGLNLYVIGGEVEAGVINLVDVYETDTNEWVTAATKPTAVADATAAELFGEIFVPGGRLADGRPTAVVEAYSPANDAWRPIAPLPEPIAGALTISDGDSLYVLGGWNGEQYLSSFYRYDNETNTWHTLPSMKQPRSKASGGFANDQLFILGGWDGVEELAVCEYFDLAIGKWATCPDLAFARSGAGAAVLGNEMIYVFGGAHDMQSPPGEVYEIAEGKWNQVPMPMSAELSGWHDLGVANVETRIYALGGRQGEDLLDNNFVYVALTHRTFLPTVGNEGP